MLRKKNLAIFRIYGGLGNQIFQYAHGRSLSLSSKKKTNFRFRFL